MRPRMQMIFQDPISSLNPRRKVRDIVAEGLEIWSIGDKASRAAKVDEVLEAVGIDPANAARRPHEFSGGQCQRISIARAVVTEPKLIICDEPVSALDVSVQAQILNLLEDMKDALRADARVHRPRPRGREERQRPRHGHVPRQDVRGRRTPTSSTRTPRTRTPRRCSPRSPCPTRSVRPDTEQVLGGEIPSPLHPPSGCRFRTRCPKAEARCAEEEPQIRRSGRANGTGPLRRLPLPARPGRDPRLQHGGIGRPTRSSGDASPRPGASRLGDEVDRPVGSANRRRRHRVRRAGDGSSSARAQHVGDVVDEVERHLRPAPSRGRRRGRGRCAAGRITVGEPGPLRGEHLLLHAADRQHPTLQRDLAGHADLGAHRRAR